MKKILIFLGVVFLCFPCRAEDVRPLDHDGKKWRVAYVEGGPYVEFCRQLCALLQGLSALGWVEPLDSSVLQASVDRENTDELWTYLARHVQSNYIEFVEDAWWSSGWDRTKREQTRRAVVKRLNRQKDIDLVIAMGTWAGQDLAVAANTTPTMILSSSDPIGAGIVKSAEDSGQDNIHAKIELDRYSRQVALFHDIIGFSRLGMVYVDTVDGRSYAAVRTIEALARTRGFTIVSCDPSVNGEESVQGIIHCHERLAGMVDAVYLTEQPTIKEQYEPYIKELLTPLLHQGIPTWSQRGSREVEDGVLLSLARKDLVEVGRFEAGVMAKIFHGKMPRSIPQVFEDPSEAMALNIKTAQHIGFNPGFDLLAAVDELYEESLSEAGEPKRKKRVQ